VQEVASELTTSAVKDPPHMRPDWTLDRELIEGVELYEVRNVVTGNGVTVEAWRPAWTAGLATLAQIVHVTLRPGAISAWHLHRLRYDGVFVVGGSLRVVLFDARRDSATNGQVDVFSLSHVRPMLVTIPPAVWHGVQVLGSEHARFVNCFDRPYDHDDPDEWRLPADSSEVPYRFS
jgi:dTDP-4-dehydrorhamnose 3,5-epimerase